MKRMAWVMGVMALAAVVSASESEFRRTLFCRENRLPELGCWEVGLLPQYAQYDEFGGMFGKDAKRKEYTTPYAAMVLREPHRLCLVPFGHVDSDPAQEPYRHPRHYLWLELLAYEYLDYPYVIPYVEIILPTGDDDKYLGNGEFDAFAPPSAPPMMFTITCWMPVTTSTIKIAAMTAKMAFSPWRRLLSGI